MDQSLRSHQFDNGLVLLVEQMRDVQSAAFTVMTPAGVIYEPEGINGLAAVTCDMMSRGAGERDSRALSSDLDFLGLQRSESVGWNFMSFGGATLAENVCPALEIYADILRRPQLPSGHLPAVVSGVHQSLLAVEDEPQRKVFVELRKRCYDSPWGRSTDGDLDEIGKIRQKHVEAYFKQLVRPNGGLIGVAGNVDFESICQQVEASFGTWSPLPDPVVKRVPRKTAVTHLPYESSQTHIGIAYDAVPYGHPDYYAAWAAVSILSGGSSSRLFTEVREKRGLCYSVFASLSTLLTEGRVLAYAGTTTERAQETLNVMLEVMQQLGTGIEQSELDRCKARAKSSLIMQQESTAARASAIARDWFHLQKINTLSEIHQQIDQLTIEQIQDYVHRYPAQNFTILTIGGNPLQVPACHES